MTERKTLTPYHTIYKNGRISFEIDDKDYRFVKATKDIKKGEIILIEQVLYSDDYETNTQNNVVMNTLYNEDLFNSLYPRNYKYNLENILNGNDKDKLIECLASKIQKNMFKINELGKTIMILGYDYTRFNHSKDPNINFHHFRIEIPKIDILIYIFYMVAFKDIKENEELTINYGNNYFDEDIDLDFYEKDKLNMSCFKSNKLFMISKINNYLDSDICKDVILSHIFSNDGLFYNQSQKRYITTAKFCLLIKGDENIDVSYNETMIYVYTKIKLLNDIFKTKYKKIRQGNINITNITNNK